MYTVFVSVLIAAAFLALWLGVWLSISYLAGMASGWRKLAALYPDTTPNQHGEMKKWVYIRFGATRYNGAIVFEALPIGLRIRTLWFFRFGQPSMVIPWSHISLPEHVNKPRWGSMYTYEFTIQGATRPVSCTVEIGEWVAAKKKELGS
jgi:hypothetical protein